MNDLRSLLNLTNKFYNAAPVEIQSTPVIEKEKKKSKAVKSKRPGLFAPDDVRKVTKVSSLDHPDMSGSGAFLTWHSIRCSCL